MSERWDLLQETVTLSREGKRKMSLQALAEVTRVFLKRATERFGNSLKEF